MSAKTFKKVFGMCITLFDISITWGFGNQRLINGANAQILSDRFDLNKRVTKMMIEGDRKQIPEAMKFKPNILSKHLGSPTRQATTYRALPASPSDPVRRSPRS